MKMFHVYRGVVISVDIWTLLNTRNFRHGIEVSSTLVSNRPHTIVIIKWNLLFKDTYII